MRRLSQPLRAWHGLLAVVAALAVGAAGTAIAGGDHGKDLAAAGFGPGGFVKSGKYRYGFKVKGAPPVDRQTHVRLKCPRGTRVISGGGGGSSGDPNEQSVNYTAPFDTRDRGRVPEDGWIVFVNNQGLEGNEAIVVQAICRKKKG